MPLRVWKCEGCGTAFKTKANTPVHCDASGCQMVITPPGTKFLEKVDEAHGKSRMIGQEKILKARARHHSREVEIDDLISVNNLDTAEKNGWIKSDGKVRKRIDDL